jgi:hypothetical protein
VRRTMFIVSATQRLHSPGSRSCSTLKNLPGHAQM